MVADTLIGGGACDGQARGNVHAVEHDANVVGGDGGAARRTGGEAQPITRVHEDHVQGEQAADERRD